MSVDSLALQLLALPAFQSRLEAVTVDSIASQFGTLSRTQFLTGQEHDWAYLLKCASVLAQSTDSRCEDAALRIGQHCLTTKPERHFSDAACVILDTLTNRPGIRLAEERGLVEADPASRLPFTLQAQWVRREIQQLTVLSDGRELSLNRFQKEFWNTAPTVQTLSITAPTSAGKSFLLCQWVAEFIRDNPTAIVVYLVPTRALIQQVENDFREKLSQMGGLRDRVNVSSLPLATSVKEGVANVMVLTQERLHLLLPAFSGGRPPSLMIIDEAQKLGDGARGVLLSNVIDAVARQSPSIKLMFASPLVSNPEILLRGRPGIGKSISSSHVTVNQNLLWVSQVPRNVMLWNVEACVNDRMVQLGQIQVPFRPDPDSKRLTFVAHVLADPRGGNLVYANGAADSEKAALQLYALSKRPATVDPELKSLIDLTKRYVHPEYALATTLERGVGFHYGNMPLLIRTEIERLFKDGRIRFLVCTSTLIEGVNLPCRSMFVRGPQKGHGRPMNETDFWNLAGRAGRLGREFQGNVICIDPRREAVWRRSPPTRRTTFPIKPAADLVFENLSAFVTYVTRGTPSDVSQKHPEYDQILSYLVAQSSDSAGLANSPMCAALDSAARSTLEGVISSFRQSLTIPIDIADRNPGISPLAMERLLKYFQERKGPVEELLPVLPESEDAVQAFNAIFGRINTHLSLVFGSTKRTFALALLVVDWTRGIALARLIGSRLNFLRRKGRDAPVASTIRSVMEDVEQVARFIAPRYVSCYIDLLRFHLHELGQDDLAKSIPDVNLWLEFGASQQTQLSMMGLGLSRTTAVALSDFIVEDNLSEDAVRQILRELPLEALGLPAAIVREVQLVLLATIDGNAAP